MPPKKGKGKGKKGKGRQGRTRISEADRQRLLENIRDIIRLQTALAQLVLDSEELCIQGEVGLIQLSHFLDFSTNMTAGLDEQLERHRQQLAGRIPITKEDFYDPVRGASALQGLNPSLQAAVRIMALETRSVALTEALPGSSLSTEAGASQDLSEAAAEMSRAQAEGTTLRSLHSFKSISKDESSASGEASGTQAEGTTQESSSSTESD